MPRKNQRLSGYEIWKEYNTMKAARAEQHVFQWSGIKSRIMITDADPQKFILTYKDTPELREQRKRLGF